ncbi:MAG: DUF169 domain-containing protein [Candidatus Methanomethyliaceae archaeon]|nr:DUF169 domain-containing protein [Candidatus Methanomethyliaceae archaeon]MDW7971049.1 DUF169 domain-containing protein [Nitrososphaerota archaeon]
MEKIDELNSYLRLKSKIVGIKLFDSEIKTKIQRRPKKKLIICQIINAARLYGWAWMILSEDVECILGAIALGLREESFVNIKEVFMRLGYVSDDESARKFASKIPRIEKTKRGFVIGPLEVFDIEPDLLIMYGNSAQIMRMVQSTVYAMGGERLTFSTSGDCGICGDGIASAYITERPQVVIPCYGERRFGHSQDDELAMVIPFKYLEGIIEGLRKTHNAGIRYPIPIAAVITELEVPKELSVRTLS